ncbi:hypothetical protein FHT70_006067, partial [Rhizobium sp. BK049]|nr:hypothetical protein [Rhizobium sp. BK049]
QMASEALPPTHYDLSTINPVHSVRYQPGLYPPMPLTLTLSPF